jgi:hypothetical protein
MCGSNPTKGLSFSPFCCFQLCIGSRIITEGDLSLEDQPRSGHPLDSNVERLTALIEDNPRLTTRDLSAMLGCNQSTIDYHLHQMGKVNKLGTWVSHKLSPDNMQQRITICNFLLSMRDRYRFLQQIVTGDEK